MERRQYSDNDKAAALAVLAANGGDLRKTARDLSIPYSTIRKWANDKGINSDVVNEVTSKKKNLADSLEEIAQNLVDAMPGKITAANLQQVATSLGITIDKMQLLRGKPTGIVDDASLTDDIRAARIAALLDAARARRDGSASGDA